MLFLVFMKQILYHNESNEKSATFNETSTAWNLQTASSMVLVMVILMMPDWLSAHHWLEPSGTAHLHGYSLGELQRQMRGAKAR